MLVFHVFDITPALTKSTVLLVNDKAQKIRFRFVSILWVESGLYNTCLLFNQIRIVNKRVLLATQLLLPTDFDITSLAFENLISILCKTIDSFSKITKAIVKLNLLQLEITKAKSITVNRSIFNDWFFYSTLCLYCFTLFFIINDVLLSSATCLLYLLTAL